MNRPPVCQVEAGSSEPQASGAVGGEVVRIPNKFPECRSRHAQISRPGLTPRGSVIRRSSLRIGGRSCLYFNIGFQLANHCKIDSYRTDEREISTRIQDSEG